MDKSRLTGHLLAVITIIIWGITFIASKVLLESFSATQIMLMRFVLAYMVLLAIRPKFVKMPWKDELRALGCGLFSNTLYFVCEINALNYTLASNVSIIVAAAPILTSVLAHFFIKDEKFRKNLIFGFIVAFTGVALVVFNGTVILKLNPLGDALSFGAALSWACYSVLAKPLINKYDSMLFTRRIVLYGLLTSLPLLLFDNKPFSFAPFADFSNIAAILFLALLGNGLCYIIWSIAIKKLGVVATNNYIYVEPFVTMLGAWVLLGEKITLMGGIGAILIILGVFISGRKNKLPQNNT